MTAVKKGFTLIELVLVIVILGILASITLPKFVNFKTSAIDRSEDAIIGNLNSAIKMKFSQNIAQGIEPNSAWPTEVPFSLLVYPPPFNICQQGATITPDNQTWQCFGEHWSTWYLHCPHWNGVVAVSVGTRGRQYNYIFGIYGYSGWGKQQGDVWLTTWGSPGH